MHEFGLTTDWLRARTLASPEALAVITEGAAYTFRELDAMVSRLCGRLRQEGVVAGDHIAILMPNSLAAVCAIFAMGRLGTIAVPLNTRLTQGEIVWQMKRADCNRMLCSPTTEPVACPCMCFPKRRLNGRHGWPHCRCLLTPHSQIKTSVPCKLFSSLRAPPAFPKGL